MSAETVRTGSLTEPCSPMLRDNRSMATTSPPSDQVRSESHRARSTRPASVTLTIEPADVETQPRHTAVPPTSVLVAVKVTSPSSSIQTYRIALSGAMAVRASSATSPVAHRVPGAMFSVRPLPALRPRPESTPRPATRARSVSRASMRPFHVATENEAGVIRGRLTTLPPSSRPGSCSRSVAHHRSQRPGFRAHRRRTPGHLVLHQW